MIEKKKLIVRSMKTSYLWKPNLCGANPAHYKLQRRKLKIPAQSLSMAVWRRQESCEKQKP
jgi:hypothetical protein